jgi:hypothetical protein
LSRIKCNVFLIINNLGGFLLFDSFNYAVLHPLFNRSPYSTLMEIMFICLILFIHKIHIYITFHVLWGWFCFSFLKINLKWNTKDNIKFGTMKQNVSWQYQTMTWLTELRKWQGHRTLKKNTLFSSA